MEVYDNLQKGVKGAWISIFAYIFLATLKLIVGYFGNSEALLADGLNNSTDVVASIAVLIGLKIARKPPDTDHHYGHFRAETVASLIAAVIMIFVGLQVVWEGLQSLTAPSDATPAMATAWVALFSAGVMYIVYRYNLQLALKIKSQALKAAAYDNRSDALVSIGAFIGIIGARIGPLWLDTIIAIIVGAIILKTAIEIFKESTHSLTDGFDEEILEEILQTIQNTPDVEQVKSIRGRMHGNEALIDTTIYVNPHLNVVESHKITEEVERRLLEQHDIRYVHIHIEPLGYNQK